MESTISAQDSKSSGASKVLKTIPDSEAKISDEQVREDGHELEHEAIFTCYSCSQECLNTDMYRCRTCSAEDNTGNNTSNNGINSFCRMCTVVTHLRRNHEVIDHKGYEPSVCKPHKNLDEYFCETCRSVFCSNCTKEHIGHSFRMLEEKAVEVRKQVFALITDNEALLKPFNHREAIVKKSLDKKISQKSFTDLADAEKLSEIYQKFIRTNTSEWSKCLAALPTDSQNRFEKAIRTVQTANSRTDVDLIQLRNLLQNSEGDLVKGFAESEQMFSESVKERVEKLKTHAYMKWAIDSEIAIKHSIKAALKRIVRSQLEKKL